MTVKLDHRWIVLHLRVLLLGLSTGLLGVLFHASLNNVHPWREELMYQVGPGWTALVVSVLFSVLLVLPGVALVRWLAPEAVGSGIPQVKEILQGKGRLRWLRLPGVKFLGGVLGIGGGLALGREGPTVQMGAALAQMLATPGEITPTEEKQLIALGAGAGLAAAFNSPLAGMLFLYEELGQEFRPSTATAGLLATASADAVTRLLLGQQPELLGPPVALPALQLLPWFMVLGALGGLLGVLFNQTLLGSMRLAHWLHDRAAWWLVPLLVAICTGITGWWNPQWVAGGFPLLSACQVGTVSVSLALGLLLLRFPLTIGSYATGSAGGLFAPLLVLGALVGSMLSDLGRLGEREVFVLVGMASLFTGIVRAPLTAVVLLIEMSGQYSIILPLLGACLVARMCADATGDRPIYEALLDMQRERSGQEGRSEPPSRSN